jgi:DNA-directed RNA polymerase specialized sigma24 family protein/predicted enzyme related to lactoylglutathione lyase
MAARGLSAGTIETLMRVAARCSLVAHEAEDLVQDVLLSAIEKDRDCGEPGFLPWAAGAVRNCARFAARTAARRRRREHAYALDHARPAPARPRLPDTFIATLPRSRRVVALLVNLGLGRREIAYLLGLSDVALRQRIAGVRRAFAGFAGEAGSDLHASFPADGLARRALKASLPERPQRRFAVRDPDGVPIFFSARDHVPGVGGNRQGEPRKGRPKMQIKFDRLTVVFKVADIDRTEKFYRDHLGLAFERVESAEEGTFLMTRIGETELLVFPGQPKPGNTPGVVFGLPDGGLDTLIERLAAAGMEIVTPVSEAPGGWYADFRDPDGQVISFFQPGEKPRRLA